MKIVSLLSGGMDSSTLAASLKHEGHEVSTIGVYYGQSHDRELAFAERSAAMLEIPFTNVNLSSLQAVFAGSCLTDKNVALPEGRYDEESMKATVVPNRNMILLSVAIAKAISIKADAVAYAAHAGDHTIYPDCRESFADIMNRAAKECDWHKLDLVRPFITQTKEDIVVRAHEIEFNLANTWSCYAGGDVHCGRCGTCIERREAFHLASLRIPDIVDPTQYSSKAPSITEMVANDWKLTD